MRKNPTWKRMRCVFFLQTSNLHPNKQKYKSEKETLYFIIQNNNKNRKHIKIKIINLLQIGPWASKVARICVVSVMLANKFAAVAYWTIIPSLATSLIFRGKVFTSPTKTEVWRSFGKGTEFLSLISLRWNLKGTTILLLILSSSAASTHAQAS